MSPSSLPPRPQISVEDDRTGMAPIVLAGRSRTTSSTRARATSTARPPSIATWRWRWRCATASWQRWSWTQRQYYEEDVKRAYYLSAEFLLGRALTANLQALDIYDDYKEVLAELGIDLDALDRARAGRRPGQRRPRPPGRLLPRFAWPPWACPASGYGIRYEYGIFDQEIRDGGRSSCPTTGCATATPGRFAGPSTRPVAVRLRRPGRDRRRDGGFKRGVAPTAEMVLGRALRHAHPRLRRKHGEHAAPVGRARRRGRSTWPFNAATTSAPWRARTAPRPSRKVLYPNDNVGRARSCA